MGKGRDGGGKESGRNSVFTFSKVNNEQERENQVSSACEISLCRSQFTLHTTVGDQAVWAGCTVLTRLIGRARALRAGGREFGSNDAFTLASLTLNVNRIVQGLGSSV